MRIYESRRHTVYTEDAVLILYLGQLIYSSKFDNNDDEILITVADMIRDSTKIENEITITDVKIKDNIAEINIIEFPIESNSKVTNKVEKDENNMKFYIEI